MEGNSLGRAFVAVVVSALLAAGVTVTAAAPQAAASGSCATVSLVGISTNTATLKRYFDHNPIDPGIDSSLTLGSGWSGTRLLAADSQAGYIYAVGYDGNLRRYVSRSSGGYGGGEIVGQRWTRIAQIIPAGAGVLYALDEDDNLRWYRWDEDRFVGGKVIGTKWGRYTRVFGGGQGILYGVEPDGDLFWYKRSNYQSATGTWSGPRLVGHGWGGFTAIVGSGDGLIYAVDSAGKLRLYNHLGAQTGSRSWASNSGVKIGHGWSSIRSLTATPDACKAQRGSPLIERAIAFAEAQLGDDYEWGAEGPNEYDCSGLTWRSYFEAGYDWPRLSSRDQYSTGYGSRVPLSGRMRGDLIFFDWSGGGIDHVAIYVGNGQIIEAPNASAPVRKRNLTPSDLEDAMPYVVRLG